MTNPNDDTNFSRRLLLGGSAAAVGVGLVGLGGQPAVAAPAAASAKAGQRASVRAAVSFLRGVTDAYRDSGPRLAQSYMDASGLNDIGFIYDNALTTCALLAAGDLSRARAIGDALLWAQSHDADFSDGRLRQAYHADSLGYPDGPAHFGYEFGLVGTAVGDMSWTGIALAQLARRVPRGDYLAGAVRIGQWIVDNTYSTTGLGGYTFGETAGLEDHKSTEHNIDVYGFFRLLARLTGDGRWNGRAQHALKFIEAVWNSDDGFFWTGSDDGAAINKNPLQLPLDVQTWFWLSVGRGKYAKSLDWAATNLRSTDTPLRTNSALTGHDTFTGAVFASGTVRTDVKARVGGTEDWRPFPNDGGVWFEGTGQLALALRKRDRNGDLAASDALLATLRDSQEKLGDGQTFGGKRIEGGIQAATSPIDTGFGFAYHPHLHTAATSWYVMAATGFNPYSFS
ncbi:hypothetical protein [Microlunatus ginsengisoli]|uniref:Tat pathway signal sequence domain protein n=1 Tax=Microlunatus ginsengisoli TaxID=363863 RepID=A0ABP6ZM08_9ACTN